MLESPSNIPSWNLETRMFLPGWWAQAYRAMSDVRLEHDRRFEQLKSSGLAPKMSVLELNSLAQMIGYLQKEFLESRDQHLVVDPLRLSLEVQGNKKTKIDAFESTLTKLGGLRVLNQTSDQSFRYERLFVNETWEQVGHSERLILELAEGSEDKLFGYVDPNTFWKSFSSEYSYEGWKQEKASPPLSLWKSIWLDLSGAEQALLFRMEEKMQWQNDWMHLDGVFEMDLLELFAGLKLPGVKEYPAPLERKLFVLKKLGRKLIEHGFLSPEIYPEYLMFDHKLNHRGVHLTWQVAPDRLFIEEAWQHIHRVGSYYTQRLLEPSHFDEWLQWMSPGLPVSIKEQFKKNVYVPIKAYIESQGIAKRDIFLLDQNNLSSYFAIFLEWNLRQYSEHFFPLPNELRDSIAARLCHPEQIGQVDFDLIGSFLQELSENGGYLNVLNMVPLATMGSKLSLEHRPLLDWAIKCAESVMYSEAHTDIISLEQTKNMENSALANQPPITDAQAQAIKQDQIKEVLGHKSFEKNKIHEVNRLAKNQMRKVAADELKRIQFQSPEDYENLKTRFFKSLGDEQRLIMEKIRKSMAYSSFESHLKKQLLEYMVQNPASWSLK